jgi:signal transduction histidine kinase/integral membrane sensor domain MASE1
VGITIANRIYTTLGIALVYAFTAQLGFLVSLIPEIGVALFWPPSGISLAAALLLGRRAFPGIALGALAANMWLLRAAEVPVMLGVSFATSLASTLAIFVAYKGMSRLLTGAVTAMRAPQVIRVCLVAALACTVSASGGIASFYVAGLASREVVADSWGMWWLGDFCGMLIFGPVIWLAGVYYSALRTVSNRKRLRIFVPAGILGGAAAAALLVFTALWNAESMQVSQALALEAAVAGNNFEHNLQSAERDLNAIRNFMYSSERVDIDEFRRYTTAFFASRQAEVGVQRVAFSARVTDAEAWETAMQEMGLASVHIYQLDSAGQPEPVTSRAEYFPIQYLQPVELGQAVIGYDIGSDSHRRRALDRSRDSGQAATMRVLRPTHLLNAGPVIMICVPIYRPDTALDTVESRRANLTGFALGGYLIGAMFENAQHVGAADIDLYLFDKSRIDEPQWYYTKTSPHRSGIDVDMSAPTLASLQDTLNGDATVQFADHTWLVLATPGSGFLAAHRSWVPWGVTVALLALGIVLGSFFIERNLARHIADVQRQKKEQALLAAQAANSSKQYFMAAAAHDVKQPLYALGMVVDTLLMSRLPEPIEPLVNNLRDSIEQMLHQFDGLMDIGKFHDGRFAVHRTKFRLGEISAQLDLEIRPMCDIKGLAWQLDMDDALVFSDKELLLRLFRNLLVNAVNYTASGSVGCAAKVVGDVVECTISDTGAGMTMELQETVIDNFIRLQALETGVAGRGMGLSIVEKINQALKLSLRLSSTPGAGTWITFRIPRLSEG